MRTVECLREAKIVLCKEVSYGSISPTCNFSFHAFTTIILASVLEQGTTFARIDNFLDESKLGDSQIFALAAELNHILWTTDTPNLDPKIDNAFHGDVLLIGGKFQCVAHSLECAALLLRRGEIVVTRAGRALVVYPEQRRTDSPHFIAKHWWITTSEGLRDLSLNLGGLSRHNPVIFQNRNLSDSNWKVIFKHNFKTLMASAVKSRAENVCGVIYQTDNKLSVTKGAIEPDLDRVFDAAETVGVHLRYLDMVIHCESLLLGGKSLRQLPQQEAWRRLAMAG